MTDGYNTRVDTIQVCTDDWWVSGFHLQHTGRHYTGIHWWLMATTHS